MDKNYTITTARLKLRQWQQRDRPVFAALNADPEVMQYFPKILQRSESDALVDRIEALIEKNGWGFWALERLDTQDFIGFTGLHVPKDLPCSPCTEIGWRLSRVHWGYGFATEAAKAALHFGFETLGLDEIVSFTSIHNQRSRAVMRRLDMHNSQCNFMHPAVPDGSYLKEHVLYRLRRQDYSSPDIS